MKRTRLRPRSAKREAIGEERRAFVERILAERPVCQGRAYLRVIVNGLATRDQEVVLGVLRTCAYRSAEVHEMLKRSRGGSIIEDDNVLALCRSCHRFTEDEPRLATEAGMLTPSWRR